MKKLSKEQVEHLVEICPVISQIGVAKMILAANGKRVVDEKYDKDSGMYTFTIIERTNSLG